MKKGQAALEFLMTYSWAIIAILVLVAVLIFSGVFDFSKKIPDKTFFPMPIPNLQDALVYSNGTIVLELTNGIPNNIDILAAVNATQDCVLQNFSTNTTTIGPSKNFVVKFNCAPFSKDRVKTDLSFRYNDSYTGFTHVQVGTVAVAVIS
jgi:hypothetical protein